MKYFIQDTDTGSEFTAAFKRLLLFVKQWVLVELIDDLKFEFQKNVTIEDFGKFLSVAESYVNKAAKENKGYLPWIRSIIFLSLQMLSKKVSKPMIWTKTFMSVSGIDSDEIVIGEFAELYKQWAVYVGKEADFAQPYAFFLLFNVAITDRLIRAKIERKNENDNLRNYLHCIENGQSHINDRLIDFAKDHYRNGNKIIEGFDHNLASNNIKHFESVSLRSIKIDDLLESKRGLNALVIGIPGSGKSTIIKVIRHVLVASLDDRINGPVIPIPITSLNMIREEFDGKGENANFYGPISKRTMPTGRPMSEAVGEIAINNKQYPLSFFDTKGGILVEAPPKFISVAAIKETDIFEKALVSTDLLLVVLDPETIFYHDDQDLYSFSDILGFITARLDYLFAVSRHAMIALVFAKFDEYGSVIRGPRNLIHNDEQINFLLRFMETGSDLDWRKLVERIGIDYSDNGAETSLQKAIMLVLERIRHLLKVIVNAKKHPVVNCYIASSAIMQDEKNSLWTGYPEVFNDFAAYMAWLIDKKELLRSPENVQAALSNNDITLEWVNPSDKEVLSIVERKKNSDPNFKVLGQANPLVQGSRWTYTDRQLEYGESYTYRIAFIDNKTDQNSSPYSEEIEIDVPEKPPSRLFPPVDAEFRILNDAVELEWNNLNTDVAVFYSVEKKENGSEYKIIADQLEAEINLNSFTDNNVDRGKIYCYRVRFNEIDDPANNSIYSEEILVRTVPNNIKQLKCEVKPKKESPEYIELTWEESRNSYRVSYIIFRTVSSKGSGSSTEKIIEFEGNSYNDKAIKRGDSYKYSIEVVEDLQKRRSLPTESELIEIESTNTLTWIVLAILIVVVIFLLIWILYPVVHQN